jgi:hypothetical protein
MQRCPQRLLTRRITRRGSAIASAPQPRLPPSTPATDARPPVPAQAESRRAQRHKEATALRLSTPNDFSCARTRSVNSTTAGGQISAGDAFFGGGQTGHSALPHQRPEAPDSWSESRSGRASRAVTSSAAESSSAAHRAPQATAARHSASDRRDFLPAATSVVAQHEQQMRFTQARDDHRATAKYDARLVSGSFARRVLPMPPLPATVTSAPGFSSATRLWRRPLDRSGLRAVRRVALPLRCRPGA